MYKIIAHIYKSYHMYKIISHIILKIHKYHTFYTTLIKYGWTVLKLFLIVSLEAVLAYSLCILTRLGSTTCSTPECSTGLTSVSARARHQSAVLAWHQYRLRLGAGSHRCHHLWSRAREVGCGERTTSFCRLKFYCPSQKLHPKNT